MYCKKIKGNGRDEERLLTKTTHKKIYQKEKNGEGQDINIEQRTIDEEKNDGFGTQVRNALVKKWQLIRR